MNRRKRANPVAKGRSREEEGGQSKYDDDDPDAVSRALTKAFKSDPSIENYVRLRRENPDADIEVDVVLNYDLIDYYLERLKKHGIERELLFEALGDLRDGRAKLILTLLEKIIEARKMETPHNASRGRVIPNKLIDWIIVACLESLSDQIPPELIVLIRERLGGPNLGYRRSAEEQSKKSSAVFLAGQMKAQGLQPTYSTISKMIGVSKSTVSRWFKDPAEFDRLATIEARLLEQSGFLEPLQKRRLRI